MKDNNSHDKSDKRATKVPSYSYQMKRTIGDNMNRTKSIIIIAIVLIIVFTSVMIVVYPYLQEDDEKEYLSVDDLWDTLDTNNGTRDFVGYSIGDIISIKGRIEKIEEIKYKEPIYNESAVLKYDITNNTKSYLNVWIDGNGFAFNYSMREKLVVGRELIFNVKIVYCDHIYNAENSFENGEEIDRQVPLRLCMASAHIECVAKRRVEIYPTINETDIQTTIIDISEIYYYFSTNFPNEYKVYCPLWYIKICLYQNDSKRDQIIFNYSLCDSYSQRLDNILKSENHYFYLNIFDSNTINQKDNITVFNDYGNISDYRMDFVWLITYPEVGYDVERVVGSISWEI